MRQQFNSQPLNIKLSNVFFELIENCTGVKLNFRAQATKFLIRLIAIAEPIGSCTKLATLSMSLYTVYPVIHILLIMD